MIFVSVDVETSGLEANKHCVLSIGAIIEDTTKKLPFNQLPKFNGVIIQREIVGSPRALTINRDLIQNLGNYIEGTNEDKKKIVLDNGYNFYEKEDIIIAFFDFLVTNNVDPKYIINQCGPAGKKTKSGINLNGLTNPIRINVAGKNYGTFDKLFLEELPWFKKLIKPRQRIIDPGILCCNFNTDDSIPSLNQCKERLGLQGEVTHNALEDAWDVIQVLRNYY